MLKKINQRDMVVINLVSDYDRSIRSTPRYIFAALKENMEAIVLVITPTDIYLSTW